MHSVEGTIVAFERLILRFIEMAAYSVLDELFQVDVDSGADIEAAVEQGFNA